jgi:hypothetical protein
MIRVFIGYNCEGKGFGELISFVTPKSKEFYLNVSPKIKNHTMRELRRYLLRVEYQKEWPGTRYAYPNPEGYPVMYFQVCEESIKILVDKMGSLYWWQDFPRHYPPEDLGFYRKDGRVLMATVSHEHEAWLNLEEGEFEKLKIILDKYGIEYSTDPNYMFWGSL